MFEQGTGVLSIVFSFVLVVGILFLAYFSTKWLSKKMSTQGNTRYIKVLDRVMLGQDKSIVVVKIAGKTMAVAMTSHTAVKLCDIDEASVEPAPPPQGMDFSSIFKNYLAKGKQNAQEQQPDVPEQAKEGNI